MMDLIRVKNALRIAPFLMTMVALIVECGETDGIKRSPMTEAQKQTAFRQLLSRNNRLRLGSASAMDVTTTEAPVDDTLLNLAGDEEKRHDRRHASSFPSSGPSVDQHQQNNTKKSNNNNKKGNKNKHANHNKRIHHAGRHVCTHEEVVTRPVSVVESYCKPAYKSFTQRCSNGTAFCTAFRVQFDTIYRTVVKYQAVTEKKHACCPGWTYHTPKQTHSCSQAVCTKGCKNGGSCVRPDVCICTPGYTGPSCENDMNECSSGTHRCQQTCVNTAGSYQCACHDGFHLLEDGRSCKFRLESVPEYQALLANYEAMSKRITALEQESQDKVASQPVSSTSSLTDQQAVDAARFESTIANMTEHILSLEDRLSQLNETTVMMASSKEESQNDYSLASLSEQVGLLEERLADCTCTVSPPARNRMTRPRY